MSDKNKEQVKADIKSELSTEIKAEEKADLKADIKAEIQTERAEGSYTLYQRFRYEVKKLLPIIVVIAIANLIMQLDLNRWYLKWVQDAPQFILIIMSLSVSAFVLGAINVIRTWLIPSFHSSDLLREVEKNPIACAMVFIIMMIFIMFFMWITIRPTTASASEIVCHNKALFMSRPYLPILTDTFQQFWPDAPRKENEPGKLDRETACPNMKKCWNPKVQLKTSREWGIGLSEVTIAYNKDGTVRFDNFKEAKRKYKKQLEGWEFEGDGKYEAKYHIIYSILEDKTNYMLMSKMFPSTIDRWAGTLVSYNAGSGRVGSRRTYCKTTPGCDVTKWFGGLDSVASPKEKMLIYGVSLQQRVNDYPYDVIFKRSKKYIGEV